MRRRALLRTAPLAATLPLAGCLEAVPGGDDDPTGADGADDYPEEWRHVDPLESDLVTFETGEFETSAENVPEVGATLDGREAWELVNQTQWALEDASFRIALDSYIEEGEEAGTWRWTMWRDADADVVYQRMAVDEQGVSSEMYNDGTRYVTHDDGDGTEYYHVPDPHWHRDRVDSHLLMSMVQLLSFEVAASVEADGTELRRLDAVEAGTDEFEVASGSLFVGTDGILRNVHADYATDSERSDRERFATDGAAEIVAGAPSIEEPEWTDEAESEERDPSVPA